MMKPISRTSVIYFSLFGFWLCSSGLGVTGSQPNSEGLFCPELEPPEYGHIVHQPGGVAKFFCHPDFSIHGTTHLHCERGLWSAPIPRCIRGWDTCGDPGLPENGYRIGNRFTVGSIVRFRCRSKYILEGPKFRICLEGSLHWSKWTPTCKERERPVVNDPNSQKRLPLAAVLTTPVDTTRSKSILCGGAVVCGKWILVPARCLEKPSAQGKGVMLLDPADIVVAVGAGGIPGTTDDRFLDVSDIYRPPQYLLGDWDHKVALLKTVTSLPLQSFNLPTHEGLPIEHVFTYTSWSSNKTSLASEMSSMLQMALTKEETNPSEDIVCAKSGDCNDMLGGPLVLTGGKTTSHLVIGMIDRLQCLQTPKCNKFTDVSKYLSWINSITEHCQ